ncbi:TPA: hypothetical protein ACT9YC_003333 [Klebsiella variicola]
MKFFTSRFMSILLLIPGMFLAQSPAQAGEEINTILPDHVIRVGAVNAPPWYQKDLLTNQWTGLVPDVVQAILKTPISRLNTLIRNGAPPSRVYSPTASIF